MFKQSIRSLATKSPISSAAATTTTASTTSTTTTASLNFAKPPSYTLAQLREFPSLEPKTFIPLPTTFFNTENLFVEIYYGVVLHMKPIRPE